MRLGKKKEGTTARMKVGLLADHLDMWLELTKVEKSVERKVGQKVGQSVGWMGERRADSSVGMKELMMALMWAVQSVERKV